MYNNLGYFSHIQVAFNSVALSKFTMLCNHCNYLFPKLLIAMNSHPLSTHTEGLFQPREVLLPICAIELECKETDVLRAVPNHRGNSVLGRADLEMT